MHASLDQFVKAAEVFPAAIVITDSNGKIVLVNGQTELMFGYRRDELLGQIVELLMPQRHGLDLVGRRKGGDEFPIEVSSSPAQTDSGALIVSIVQDITERRRVEEALKQAEATRHETEKRFRLLANTAPVMIWMSGIDKLCTYVNQRWLEFTGRPLEAELGNGWAESVHPDDLNRFLDTYARSFDRREPFQMEYRLRRHDGEYRWIVESGVPRFNTEGLFTGYIGSAIDVTEHKLAVEALSTVSRKLIQAQEEERARIARELHDDIGQRVALLGLNLERLRTRNQSSVTDGIVKAIQYTANLGSDIQALSHRLHSSKLEYLGLAAATDSYCTELSDYHKVTIELHSQDVPNDLSQEIALCMFRVLQEALQNAIKHSGVRRFQVSLNYASPNLSLTVGDSGIGFHPAEGIRGRGLGLISMKERIKLVGGELSIESQPGSGTTIHARIPLFLEEQPARATSGLS